MRVLVIEDHEDHEDHEDLAGVLAHGLTVRRELRTACAHGDSSLLSELADNLISNAVKYNEPGGLRHKEPPKAGHDDHISRQSSGRSATPHG
jgi:hypothetical protein